VCAKAIEGVLRETVPLLAQPRYGVEATAVSKTDARFAPQSLFIGGYAGVVPVCARVNATASSPL
jgi:hypothetical protein